MAITEKRDGLQAELATSEERVARLRQDVSFAGGGQSIPQFHNPAEVLSELERGQCSAGPRFRVEAVEGPVAQLQGDSTLVERPRVRGWTLCHTCPR